MFILLTLLTSCFGEKKNTTKNTNNTNNATAAATNTRNNINKANIQSEKSQFKDFEKVANSFIESLTEIEEEDTKKELEQLIDNIKNDRKSDTSQYIVKASALYLDLAGALAKNNIEAVKTISDQIPISYDDFDEPGLLAFIGTLEASNYMVEKLVEKNIQNGDDLLKYMIEVSEEDLNKIVDPADDLEETLKEARQISYRLLIDLVLSFK